MSGSWRKRIHQMDVNFGFVFLNFFYKISCVLVLQENNTRAGTEGKPEC